MSGKDRCPFCNSRLTEIRKVGHASRRDEDGRRIAGTHLYTAHCAECGLHFRRSITGRDASPWRATRCNAEWLTEQLDTASVSALSQKLSRERYPAIGEKWQAFVKMARPTDVFWRCTDPEREQTGIAIVRDGLPVADFWTFGNL